MDKDQFISYLQGLIHDLKDSGSTSTAQDFQAALCFLTGAQRVDFDPQNGEPKGKQDYSEELKIGSFLTLGWTDHDVREHKPEWSLVKCQSWLEANEDKLRDRTVELGGEALADMLTFDS